MKNEKRFLELVKRTNDDKGVERRRALGFSKYGDLFEFSNIENIDIEKFRIFLT